MTTKRSTSKPKAKAKRRKPKKPAEAELKPLKIIGCQLIGGYYNEHGELVGEERMTDEPFAIYAPDFKRLPQIVDKAVDQRRELERIQREAMEESQGSK